MRIAAHLYVCDFTWDKFDIVCGLPRYLATVAITTFWLHTLHSLNRIAGETTHLFRSRATSITIRAVPSSNQIVYSNSSPSDWKP